MGRMKSTENMIVLGLFLKAAGVGASVSVNAGSSRTPHSVSADLMS
jgi:hypothetical protein